MSLFFCSMGSVYLSRLAVFFLRADTMYFCAFAFVLHFVSFTRRGNSLYNRGAAGRYRVVAMACVRGDCCIINLGFDIRSTGLALSLLVVAFVEDFGVWRLNRSYCTTAFVFERFFPCLLVLFCLVLSFLFLLLCFLFLFSLSTRASFFSKGRQ
ncbi:hypothetical protein BJ508DRAFT_127554 [Ascobolus immersus RN42]|uniref:Uncharacterized protein n=1 Tax=Ascobolus immersus RN42 TaxID=1160509 RepID=A0A3N4I301_ASCIM|nr:hypothetical protein BJ508DRAFT_127554 [Ascobolus immersus RN42]